MKPIFLTVLIFAFKFSFSQNRIGVFENQVSRTQHLNWEYVYTDSSSAFQDTIEGIERYFWTSGTDTVKKQIVYTYDYHSVLDGSIDYDLYRDWNSFGLDSVYAHGMFFQDNPRIADSMKASQDTLLGASWNEDYRLGDRMVIFEDMFMRVEYGWEPPVVVISYLSKSVDTSVYEAETEPVNIKVSDNNFDFSGIWIGRVTRYVYDIPQDTFLSLQHQDSMLQVYFKPLDSVTYKMIPDTVWEQGYDWNTIMSFKNGNWVADAEYHNPDWSASSKLLSDHSDSLYYNIVVDPVQVDAFDMQLSEGEEFGWIWLFYRINAIKEE